MMGIEIPNGDPRDAARERVERGDGDRVQIAKAHGLLAGRVVPRRAHQRESALAAQGQARAFDGGAGRARRVLENAVVKRGVGIERPGFLQAGEVALRVRSEQGLALRGCRRLPRPCGVREPQVPGGAPDPLGTFGVAGQAVAGAALVMEDGHGGNIAGNAARLQWGKRGRRASPPPISA